MPTPSFGGVECSPPVRGERVVAEMDKKMLACMVSKRLTNVPLPTPLGPVITTNWPVDFIAVVMIKNSVCKK